jgi:hypothetical protein
MHAEHQPVERGDRLVDPHEPQRGPHQIQLDPEDPEEEQGVPVSGMRANNQGSGSARTCASASQGAYQTRVTNTSHSSVMSALYNVRIFSAGSGRLVSYAPGSGGFGTRTPTAAHNVSAWPGDAHPREQGGDDPTMLRAYVEQTSHGCEPWFAVPDA